ncbi:MAG: hypothetical protein BIFFINMI_03072 [Phycisphaerae bacterium]|nr:hypothetical protein [Phycisphaerae bacterium]
MNAWTVTCLRTMTPFEVKEAVAASSRRYAEHWNHWLRANPAEQVGLLGSILRKWQATRPHAMRRARSEDRHKAPYLDDLVAAAGPHIHGLTGVVVRDLPETGGEVLTHLESLWSVFEKLPIDGCGSCVGISKAVLLLTRGRIGPAFDSKVRRQVGRQIKSAGDWIAVLRGVGEDIRAFEARHGPLATAVPTEFSNLECGRLYDMAFGPR